MCGIAGIFFRANGKTFDIKKYSSIFLSKLRHRGPDSDGFYYDSQVLLTHNRLAIIDLSSKANQPFVDEENGLVIVFNGEILNYLSIREELKKKGYHFRTNSDTEVVLKAFHAYGSQCLKIFNGFYALAIWNKNKQELFLARDPTGIKPLYYYSDTNYFTFASELKALYHLINTNKIDYASLVQYFLFTYIPQPYTIFENVFSIKPGHFSIINNGDYSEISYFTLHDLLKSDIINDYNYAQNEIRKKLFEAVESSLIADVQIGCFLSGGIDSSIITALASSLRSNIKTFSIAFPEATFHNESKYACLIARKFNTDHHEFNVTEKELLKCVDPMLEILDQPYADSSALAMYVLSQNTSKYVKVTLSGDGADELFGGYNKHRAELRIRKQLMFDKVLRWIAPLVLLLPESRDQKIHNYFRKLKKYVSLLKCDARTRYIILASFTSEKLISKLLAFPIDRNDLKLRFEYVTQFINDNNYSIQDVLASDINMVLPSDMHVKVDSMSMAHALEVRPPFLHNGLIEFSFSIPTTFKVLINQNKRILRDAYNQLLPAQILKRKKHGFEVPLNIWYLNVLKNKVIHYLLNDKICAEHGFFNKKFLKEVATKVTTSHTHPYKELVWSVLVFQHWYEKIHNI